LLHFDVDSFPSLLREPHPVLDAYDRHTSPATADKPYTTTVTFFNTPKYFQPRKPSAAAIIQSGDSSSGDDIDSGAYLQSITPLSAQEVNGLHRHLLKMRRVVQQTGKGRFARMAAVVVTGNGRGMVGYGEGKDVNAAAGVRKAFHAAVKTMDFVERHNGHTIPAEVSGKWSATKVFLRPRPPGFGLHVPPVIHAIARCAGITDLSASIIGSTNPLNVAKATLSILWGGSAPQGMGDGIGGGMRRADKGVGARSIRDLEMARGRRLREVEAGQ
jgi:small subunit ribosomal protein S5